MADLTPGTIKVFSDTVISVVQAGEAITAGADGVYLSSGKYYKCDASDSGKYVVKGIPITSAAADGYFVLASGGGVDIGATLTVNSPVRCSATGITHDASASGHYMSEVGYAETAARLNIDIRTDDVQTP